MRRFLSLFAIAIIALSCNNSTKQTKPETVETTSEITKNEKKMGTIQLTKTEFLTKVHNYEKGTDTWTYLGDKPAIIDFYADWCGPCKQIAPILEELANEYADDIYIYKVDVDSEEELAAMFDIRTIPTMLFIPMEGKPQKASGIAPKAELEKVIKDFLVVKKQTL